MQKKQKQYDVLIIGSGAAGLTLALQLAPHAQVVVLSKNTLKDGSTFYAQGGISAVLDKEDSFESHAEDTLNAGAGLCNPNTVRHVIAHGPDSIRWLESLQMPFTQYSDNNGGSHYHLTREGGHSHRRVIHADDATGQALENTLESQSRRHPNITLFEHHNAVDLITKLNNRGEKECIGAYVLNRERQQIETFLASVVILASGGASKVYLYSSNPDGSTGDGIAMAWRAGCQVANMEFMQFHPTCLYHPKAKSSLISEAVRGEGGKLLLPDGSTFMHRFDARAELAPRDIVARAIDHEMKRLGAECLYLDISHKPADFILKHFPNIHQKCQTFGIDMTQEPIPVVPAAHYTCGGVVTDLKGRTQLRGLYAIGETASTGLHGANRMASNSLLECLVFARSAAEDIIDHQLKKPRKNRNIPLWDESRVTNSDEEVVVSHNWDELRRFMWDYVGIVRTNKRLQRAKNRIELLQREIHDYYGNFRVSSDLLELRNLALVAELIIRSAQQRKESRGLHYTLDYPKMLSEAKNTLLTPAEDKGIS